nr:acidic repeat-containing protein-like [Aedes albopictus]
MSYRIGRCSSNSSENFESIENADNNDGSFETDNSLPQDQQQPETITNAFEREASVLSPDGTEVFTALQDALLDELEDDIREFEAEQQRQNRIHHFSFKLNSATLSIIEEKTDDDSSVNQQTPEKTVVEMNENERLVSVEAGDETHQEAELDIPVDSEGNEGLGNSQDDEVPDESSVPVDNEDNSSERSLKGFEDVEMLLNRMPLVTKLRMLTRFRSFDYPRGGADDDEESDEELEEQTRHPPKKFNLKDFKDKMQSESKLNISEGDDEHDEEGADDNESEVGDDDAIVPDELEENFDLEAAIDEVLAEQSPEVQKAKWKMLKRILRKIPYRANSFDLFSESDEDILENLFDQKRKEMRARSTDSVDDS